MRKNEILKRLAEIKDLLTGTTDIDFSAIEAESRALQAELAGIESRAALANQINIGAVEGTVIPKVTEKKSEEDPYSTLEYRKQFMEFCKTGKMPTLETRLDAFTSTTEAAAVIPTTIMNEVISEMKKRGQLFSRVRKSNIKGGVQVPILSLKPTATRITEATPSDRKKVTVNTYVSFNYYGLECKIATSLIANEVTLPSFESALTPLIAEAMIATQEIEIIKGTGVGECLGVTLDPRVVVGQHITLSAADFTTYEGWKKKVFAKIPLSYRAGGLFIMAAGTFEGYIDGMVDANGQPIGRVNYGITDGIQERFAGKEVMLVEEDVVVSYDAAAVGDVVAIFMKPSDYCVNSNMQMVMYRWLDHDTNQWVDKAILISDGKLLDAAGVIIVKKGA
jgi:HK97 family phage major capsid protein